MKSSVFPVEARRRAAAAAIALRERGYRAYLRPVAADYGVTPATVRTWIETLSVPSPTLPALPAPPPDPFPLGKILICRLCSTFMIGTDIFGLGPVYRCPPACRRRCPIPAAELHDRILRAVSHAAPAAIRHPDGRLDITRVPALIGRISIGETLEHLSLAWRA
jgi:hypothetical protein